MNESMKDASSVDDKLAAPTQQELIAGDLYRRQMELKAKMISRGEYLNAKARHTWPGWIDIQVKHGSDLN